MTDADGHILTARNCLPGDNRERKKLPGENLPGNNRKWKNLPGNNRERETACQEIIVNGKTCQGKNYQEIITKGNNCQGKNCRSIPININLPGQRGRPGRVMIPSIIHYRWKRQYLLPCLSSWCGRIHRAAYRAVHRYAHRSNRAVPAACWPAAVPCGTRRNSTGLR